MAVEQRLSASYQQREAMQDWVQSAIDERAALQEDLDTTTQELQAHKDAQAAAPADAAQPILPEIDWVWACTTQDLTHFVLSMMQHDKASCAVLVESLAVWEGAQPGHCHSVGDVTQTCTRT